MLLEPSDQWEPGSPTVNSNLFLSMLEMNETVQFPHLSPSAESYFSVFLIIHETKIRRKQTDDMMELNPIIVRLMMFTFLIFTVVVILLLSDTGPGPGEGL